MTELQDLIARQTQIIKTVCNVVGCKDCGLKWDSGCSSTDLQDRIIDIEMQEYKDGKIPQPLTGGSE